MEPGIWPAGVLDPHYPWQLIHEGYTVLLTGCDGTIEGSGRSGLYDYDTRILSRRRLTLDGRLPQFLSGGPLDACRWESHLAWERQGGSVEGPQLPQDAVELLITRRVGQGMAERIEVRNHSMANFAARLEVELEADFADVSTVDGRPSVRGRIVAGWEPEAQVLRFDYSDRNGERRIERALRVRIVGSAPVLELEPRVRLSFPLELAPHQRWEVRLIFGSLVDGSWREPPAETPGRGTPRDELRARWQAQRAVLEASDARMAASFERAANDLLALRAWEYDLAPDAWLPNAGVPTYTGIFGRDVLTASWQGALLGPEMMRGALGRLAGMQASEDSAWRDAAPGKLPHEVRRGPLAELELIPQRAYYGEETAPLMFAVVLSEYWHWTGDLDTVRGYRATLERLFEWAARAGDSDGDGLLEYEKRSPKGLKNQAWKDSDEAIRYPDGSLVPDPIACIEEQAFYYMALQRMAELLLALDEEREAERFLDRAKSLRELVNRAFWMEEEQFYAMALDPAKRRVSSIASNAGHALAAGLVPPARARAVAERLLSAELYSGWGVRTLSSRHPSYNPLAYHLGTVWPVENATFALGFKRYGLDEQLERLATGLFEAASHFQGCQLPEVLGGQGREESVLPTLYPRSEAPQAWSASAIILLVQAMLGLYAFAPAHLLAVVRPRLPEWLQWLIVRRVRVGDAVVSLRFDRKSDGSAAVGVLEKSGGLLVVTVPPPVDLNPSRESWLDQLKEWGLEHLPGRMARMLRIAVGIEA